MVFVPLAAVVPRHARIGVTGGGDIFTRIGSVKRFPMGVRYSDLSRGFRRLPSRYQVLYAMVYAVLRISKTL